MAATLKCDTIQNASSATANLTLDASGNATVAGTLAMGSSFKRNRIINGDMRVDQRNAGASVGTASGSSVYTIDRWVVDYAQTSKFTVQQNAGSITPPVGFTNYLGITSSSAYSVATGDYFLLNQRIEGFNIADFGWGTANAKTVTLSFWVRSSLTGAFGGALRNDSSNRSYPFSYTVFQANTWEQKSITVLPASPGNQDGTWLTNNGIGMYVYFGLGVGSTYSGTAGAWAATNYISATGATSIVGTSGATFYITGVQLEVGSVATPYERQIYSEQLAQCQRYLPAFNATGAGQQVIGPATIQSTTAGFASFPFLVQPRTPPTGVSVVSTFQTIVPGVGTYTVTPTFGYSSLVSGNVTLSGTSLGAGTGIFVSNSATAQILFTGCEL